MHSLLQFTAVGIRQQMFPSEKSPSKAFHKDVELRGDCGGEEEFTLTPSAPECSEYSLPKKKQL
jgi:hypothetical protein